MIFVALSVYFLVAHYCHKWLRKLSAGITVFNYAGWQRWLRIKAYSSWLTALDVVVTIAALSIIIDSTLY